MARTFTEAEAQNVFARVAEKQRAAGTAAPGELSLGDLEEAARAAGLDPALVAVAAAEIDAPAPRRGVFGAPVETVRQRVVRGRVSDETWEAMVAAARSEFGRTGTAGQLGRTREWSVATGTGNAQPTTRLALEPAGEDTRLVVTSTTQDIALGMTIAGGITTVLALVFATLAAFGVEAEFWIPAAILAVQSVAFIGGTQVGLRLWHRRQTRRVDALLDRLELAARTNAPDRTAREQSAPEGRIDAGLLDADESAVDSKPSTARRART